MKRKSEMVTDVRDLNIGDTVYLDSKSAIAWEVVEVEGNVATIKQSSHLRVVGKDYADQAVAFQPKRQVDVYRLAREV